MKYNEEIDQRNSNYLKKFHLLSKTGCRDIDKIKDFLNDIDDIKAVFNCYLTFVVKCPFKLGEPVKDRNGKFYLVTSLNQSWGEEELKWTNVDVLDIDGKTHTFRIDEMVLFNNDVKEVVNE